MLQVKEATQYKLINLEELRKLTQAIIKKPVLISLDLETTGLNPRQDKIACMAFGTLHNVYILDTREFYTCGEEERSLWKSSIGGFIQACPKVVGMNIKFDWKHIMFHFGVAIGSLSDVMLQELVIYGKGSSGADREGLVVSLEAMGSRYGYHVHKEERSWFIDLDKREEWNLPLPVEQLEYVVQDIIVPLQINLHQEQALKELNLEHIAELEHVALPCVGKMELDGAYVDRERWEAILENKKVARDILEQELQEALTPYILRYKHERYDEEVHSLNIWLALLERETQTILDCYLSYVEEEAVQGKKPLSLAKFKTTELKGFREIHPRPKKPVLDESPINLGSHLHLQIALEAIGVYVTSTDEAHLEPYKARNPLIAKLLEWRDLDHFLNAFGYSLLARIEEDGRIHPSYNQLGAATGRFSCSKPNWQQLPSHEPDDTSVRRCIVGEGTNVLLTADFSNIELRILAEISQDATMLRLFKEGKDLHSTTAINMFSLPILSPEEIEALALTDKGVAKMVEKGLEPYDITARQVSPYKATWRDIAKTINFGLVYGMSPIRLSNTLGVSKEKAEELFNAYFETYPQVKVWLDTSSREALEKGYSLTIGGRKRFYTTPQEPKFNRASMEWEEFLVLRSDWYKIHGSHERQAKNAPIQGTSADLIKLSLAVLYKKLPSHVKIVACVHDEILLEVPEQEATKIASILSKCMTWACKKYLRTVTVPDVDVNVDRFWRK